MIDSALPHLVVGMYDPASDLAHAVPLAWVAGSGHGGPGDVNWQLLASLLVGSLPGICFGSHLASRISEKVLQPAPATSPVPAGGKLIAF